MGITETNLFLKKLDYLYSVWLLLWFSNQKLKHNVPSPSTTTTIFVPAEGEGAQGVEPPIKVSKRGALTGSQLLEGGSWERGGDFFQEGGGFNFHIKNKLRKRVHKEECFSLS